MPDPASSQDPALEPGLEATVRVTVEEDMTAARVGSGTVGVLATPQIVALAERAAVAALEGRLPDGTTSVGTSVSLDHLAPTPVGADVDATARLDTVDGRRLHFSFAVRDPAGDVARGRHVRVLVDRSSFEETARARIAPRGAATT
jgi:predicted thioesterase